MKQKKKRILSGMRPTGRLHLGNYVGALENWIKLQNQYHSFHMVADWHMLTTAPESTLEIHDNCIEVVIDWISAGLDPQKSPLFIQSHIPEHAELYLIFSMLISVARLQRNPTVKEQARDLGLEDTMSFGHLGYPVLQAADILLYKADAVPVGEDQAPHVEITREMARRFNYVYKNIFPEPETILTRFARLPGLDGKKMSKSMNNSIFLSDSQEDIEKKIMQSYTDPTRIRKTDPGHPEGCVVFAYHQKFSPENLAQTEHDCKAGLLGCVEHKRQMACDLAKKLAPIQERRNYYENHRDEVKDIIRAGDSQAKEVAASTLSEVMEAMHMG
jgi:tryptophanyl-tRNA synthetase